MTTIAVVRKAGRIAIAADTLTKWGSAKESAEFIVNHEKILRVGDSYLAMTGTTTFLQILADYFSRPRVYARFGNVREIFQTWHRMHAVLKDRYYLLPEEDKEDALESSRMDVLIANPHGIFGVAAHRTVQEFDRFYAFGSGSDYALGAMVSVYDAPGRSAQDIARHAIAVAATFDDGTGLPITSYMLRQRARRSSRRK
ncbi:MAG TPA: MFS transporter [Burkholderiales bacterium]|nr:MFS transporter [Burkholderiales bacterium]